MADQRDHEREPIDELQVPMRDISRFVRQLSHDIRNSLNAAELQAAFITEIAEDEDLKADVKRLREIFSELAKSLQQLTNALGDVKLSPIEYRAGDLVDDLRRKVTETFPQAESELDWKAMVDNATLNIDPQLLQIALLEVFDNALRHDRGTGKIEVAAQNEGTTFVLTLREPKTGHIASMDTWGREPLRNVAHGRYGLGLYRSQRILDAHRGRLDAHFDSDASTLVTTITLPLTTA